MPAERVGCVLAVSVQHMRGQYAQLRGTEAMVCVPDSERQIDCPLRMTLLVPLQLLGGLLHL